MANDATQLALIIGVKALVDTSYAAKTGKNDPVVALVANGLIFSGLAVFGGIINQQRLAIAVAYVFLLGTLVLHGMPLIESSTGLISSARNRAARVGTGGTF